MKYINLIIILVAVLIVGMNFYLKYTQGYKEVKDPTIEQSISLKGEKAIVYKTSSCGCCAVYVTYLKKEGLDVEVVDVPDIYAIKKDFGVSEFLTSCHTTVIGGYVVEGHIPLSAIKKLMAEKPDIKGIALPGMPIGSPGMPGKKVEPFEIYKLGEDGLFMTI
jgi:hypothetical protein